MSISSKTPLQMGNNAFFLYIDAQQFNQYQQSRQGKRDILIYAIPQGIYQDLKMGAAIWLTYGELFEATSSNDERTQLLNQNPRNCWSLGALNTKKIKK